MRNITVCIYVPRIWLNGTYRAILGLVKNINNKCNITIMYSDLNKNDQLLLDELSNYVVVEQYKGECKYDVCISAALTNPPMGIRADKYIQWFHSDVAMLNTNFTPDKRFSEYVVVSDYAKSTTDAYYGIDCKVIHCDINVDNQDDDINDDCEYDLKLVTASRIHPDKGFDKAFKLATLLRSRGVKFKWYILGHSVGNLYSMRVKEQFKEYDEVVFIHGNSNPYPYIKWADYGVLFSKRETWGLFINECLYLTTPVIVNDIPVIHEQVIHGENGYIFNDNIDVDIIMNIPTVEYNNKEHYTKWFPILGIDCKKEE